MRISDWSSDVCSSDLLALPCRTGCAPTVYPPAMVAEPARVAALDHGQHSSLVIALPGDAMVRYAYGDRRYFALRQTGSTEGIAALFWPTQAVLGRARLRGSLWPDSLRQTVREAFEDVLFFEVDAGAARRLVAKLDGFFDRNAPKSEEHTSELQSLMRLSYAVFCLKTKTNMKT